MKRIAQTLLMGLLVLAPAFADNAALDFQLFNRTQVHIKKLYISPSNANNWEEDLLGGRMLLNGADVMIQFHPDHQAAKWDIRVEDPEGGALEFEDIDLTETEQVILNADHTATLK